MLDDTRFMVHVPGHKEIEMKVRTDDLMSIVEASPYRITIENETQCPEYWSEYWIGSLSLEDRPMTLWVDVGDLRSAPLVTVVVPNRFRATNADKAFIAMMINAGLPEKYHVSGDAALNAMLIMHISFRWDVPPTSDLWVLLQIPVIFDFDITLESIREQALLLCGVTLQAHTFINRALRQLHRFVVRRRAGLRIKKQLVESFRNPSYEMCRKRLLKGFMQLTQEGVN